MNPGTYKARAIGGALGETEGGKPQIAVEYQVSEGECHGETITWFGYFTEKTIERTMQALRNSGWKTDDLTDLAGLGDTEVKIVCDEEEYNGEVRLKVQWVNSIGGLGLKKPMTPEQAKAFAARMKGAAVASRGTAGAAPKPAPKRQSARSKPDPEPSHEFDGDDIPF